MDEAARVGSVGVRVRASSPRMGLCSSAERVKVCDMDFSEATRTVFNRILKIEPGFASKIIGYVLLKDYGDREMIRLAFGPDSTIHSLVNEAKAALSGLALSPKPTVSDPVHSIPDLHLQFATYSPVLSHPFSCAATIRVPAPCWDSLVSTEEQQVMHNVDFTHTAYASSVGEDYRLQNEARFLLDDQLDRVNSMPLKFANDCHYQEATAGGGVTVRSTRRSPGLPELPPRACHYYYKGYCKHGTNCRYLHGQAMQDGFIQFFNPSSNDMASEDHVILSVSLERLEREIVELLKSRGGQPISIAMLPMLYFEKYGKMLQAEGYLTESQRHGKAGFSLTRLLARLKSTIRIVDRPHGQHSVMLVEDALRHMDHRTERNDPNDNITGSQQIYLTFPAESTFTEEDVSNYFKQFGPVRDVRIPCQQKRMFGFVTFENQETAKLILSKRNPHYVCGARVLVKPYREKSRTSDRFLNNSGLLKKQLLEEHERALELQRKHLSELHLGPKPMMQQSLFGFRMEELKVQVREDPADFPSADNFTCQTDILNSGSTSDDRARHSNNFGDQESLGFCLPDNPFASASVANGISTVT
ncbi:hypothetical protein Taro_027452 [Colocasia esculenta]|uniref:Zinc finger CCCH domain-containing protein 18 n=1 Tax=Colocasia esculenta TaxID=4460 RepID=A0A843VK61_COLES|nr:hypothetical protein [Colocasia esculenta]